MSKGDHEHHARPSPQQHVKPDSAASWDAVYGGERIWSDDPNGALVAEVAGLTPGRVLDVGCGEGADAVWLGEQGWQVTATDISGVAIERARAAAAARDLDIDFQHVDLHLHPPAPGSFDLVSLQYLPVLRAHPHALGQLVDAVAPGGTLLVVAHVLSDDGRARAKEHGFDLDSYHEPRDVLALFNEDWTIEVDEDRPRTIAATSGGAHHHDDVVVRARRRPSTTATGLG